MRTNTELRNDIARMLDSRKDPALDVTFQEFAQRVNSWTGPEKTDFLKMALESDKSVGEIISGVIKKIRKQKAIAEADRIMTVFAGLEAELDRIINV